MIRKKVFKATDTISRKTGVHLISEALGISGIPTTPGAPGIPAAPIVPGTFTDVQNQVNDVQNQIGNIQNQIDNVEDNVNNTQEDVQDQIDDITDNIENKYYVDYVFDKYDYFISTKPFYFYFEIPLGTVEIVSARVSFEVKDYRNSSLTDSRYAITGDSEARPIITFYVSEDKGCKFGSAYGQYETDMRAIDISGDLTGQGIKVLKFTTDNDVCVSARVFLKLKISKKELPTPLGRPEIRTLTATSITSYSATLNGDIIKVGSGNVIDRTTGEITPVNTCNKRGFKYATTKADTNNKSETGSFVKGKYNLGIAGLSKDTTYYFRAYADNPLKIFGEYLSFTTSLTGYLVSCDTNTDKIYIHEGITSTISSEFASPGISPYDLDYDGNNLISCEARYPYLEDNRIYIHEGITSTISSSFIPPYSMISGLAYTGSDLISCYVNYEKICIHNGITADISSEFSSPSTSPYGLTYDGSNLISGDQSTDLTYVHTGVTSTITDSFSNQDTAITGLTYDEINLMSCDRISEKIYIHDGITSNLLNNFDSPSTEISGIVHINE